MKSQTLIYLVISIFLFVVFGCESEQERRYTANIKANQKLNELINKEVSSPGNTKNALLNIPLNISKQQYYTIIDSLIKTGKLSEKTKGIFNYDFEFEIPFKIRTSAFIVPEFHKDNLYELSLVLEPENTVGDIPDWMFSGELSESIHRHTRLLYFERYGGAGNAHFINIPGILEHIEDKPVWVYGTTKITINHNFHNQTIITYGYTPTILQIEEEELKTKERDKSETLSDI